MALISPALNQLERIAPRRIKTREYMSSNLNPNPVIILWMLVSGKRRFIPVEVVLCTTAQHRKARTSVGCVHIQLLEGANARVVKNCVWKPPFRPENPAP